MNLRDLHIKAWMGLKKMENGLDLNSILSQVVEDIKPGKTIQKEDCELVRQEFLATVKELAAKWVDGKLKDIRQ